MRRSGIALAAALALPTFGAAAAPGSAVKETVVSTAAETATLQQSARYASARVSLWPEYDRRAVLVIYDLEIAAGVALPARLQLPIPAAAGPPHAVAEGRDGGLFNVDDWERSVDGEQATISFTASSPRVRIEYYDPALQLQGGQRRFVWTWTTPAPIDSLEVAVQRPARATELDVEPPPAAHSSDADGLTYAVVPLGRRSVGERVEVSVAYEKSTDALTVDLLPAPSTAGAGGAVGAASRSSAPLVPAGAWVLGALALVALVGLAAVLLWRRRDTAAGGGAPVGRAEAGGPAAYCVQCGARAGGGDRFCHACGARLRR